MPASSSSARTVGQLVVDALIGAGVRHVFGVPGESFMGMLDAMYETPLRFVSTRHEGGASFMASSYSKISGEIGVCVGTRAVGSANMTIGIHNAKQDSTPMIAIAGQVSRAISGREAFQEVDLVGVMSHYCKWATEVTTAGRVPEVMAKAIHIATSGRPGPVFLSVPQDVWNEATATPTASRPLLVSARPDLDALRTALDALLSAKMPLIFSGGGLYHSPLAGGALVKLAEASELPVITSWRHHDGFPNDHRLYLGSASLGAPRTVWQRIEDADAILVLGNRMQENSTQTYRLPSPGTRLFQVDLDVDGVVNHRVPEIAIQADASAALEALLAMVPSSVPGLSARRQRNDADRARFEDATTLPPPRSRSGSVDYACVVGDMMRLLPPEAIVSTDGGNFYAWLSRYFRFRRWPTYVGPASGAMGYGLPGAIGAKMASPGVPVVSVSGDGGFLMTMQELETAVRYDVPVVAVVLDNQRHGTIRMHQEREHPGRPVGTELTTPDLAGVARAFGAAGWRVAENEDFGPALAEALVSRLPAVVHVLMDREQLSVDQRLASHESAP